MVGGGGGRLFVGELGWAGVEVVVVKGG
jgi:hypothetical protein